MPCSGELADVVADVLGRHRIDGRERLVEQDQQRLAHQAAGDLEPPLLAAGAPGGRVLADVGSLNRVERLVGPVPPLGRRTAAGRGSGSAAALRGWPAGSARRSACGRCSALATGSPCRGGRGWNIGRCVTSRPSNTTWPSFGAIWPVVMRKLRRLAGPVRPEQPDDLAGAHVERHPVHDLPLAVVLDQPADFEQGHARPLPWRIPALDTRCGGPGQGKKSRSPNSAQGHSRFPLADSGRVGKSRPSSQWPPRRLVNTCTLFEAPATVPDPRSPRGPRHPLPAWSAWSAWSAWPISWHE